MRSFLLKVNKPLFRALLLAICILSSIVFVNHNHALYDKPIAEVTEVKTVDTEDLLDRFENHDSLYTQEMKAVMRNGDLKGQVISLTNVYSDSGAYDIDYQVGNDVFVTIKESSETDSLTGTIQSLKRDHYVLLAAWVFILTLLFVGRKQGFFAVISLVVNAAILSYALDVYLGTGISLLWICGGSVVIFTVISLILVNGLNEKTFAAIITTSLGTFVSFGLTFLVMEMTKDSGLRYEEMQFLTSPYRMVFLAGLFIGSLGAVMDVAITLVSSIFGLYEKKPDISVKALQTSGFEIGKDIMGTMTNILFFAYISGSIPMLILYLKNASPLGFTLSMNLSLEMARAFAGGIGIVITIPIGLYTAIFFINRKRSRL